MEMPLAPYLISDDRRWIDWPRVHQWLGSCYWTPGIERERVERGARCSALVVGAYLIGASGDREQVGYLRVVSDTTRLAYLCDVWVDEAHRGRKLAQNMTRFALDHPDLRDVSVWALRTRDAHAVYRTVGFEPIDDAECWMMLRKTAPAVRTR